MVLPEKDSQHAQEIERAVIFLVVRMLESGHNPKPVIFHSIRMGVMLYDYNYEPDLVKAAILHDIIEDSDTSASDVAEMFGDRVAEIVQANTIDKNAGDRPAQGKECLQRCLKYGRDALIVMAADKLDNSLYVVNPAEDLDFSEFWVAEMWELVNASEPVLINEPIWEELNKQCQKLQITLKELDNW
jgi:(p)ppGpp synthase/HD superfamily hydrolase